MAVSDKNTRFSITIPKTLKAVMEAERDLSENSFAEISELAIRMYYQNLGIDIDAEDFSIELAQAKLQTVYKK